MELIINRKDCYTYQESDCLISNFSTIYKGYDKLLQREVCIKEIHLNNDNKQSTSKAMSEVQAIVRISSDCDRIPKIYDVSIDYKNSKMYIIMEWITGYNILEAKLHNEKKLAELIIELCDILLVLNKKRIYHKDIKPDNIIINKKGLYLIDFNISISVANQVEGTLFYKAPEMCGRVKTVDRSRSDIFSIGVMMYEIMTGVLPKEGLEYAKLSRRNMEIKWDIFIEPKEKENHLSFRMNDIIKKCMAMNPKDRFKDISELKRELKKI